MTEKYYKWTAPGGHAPVADGYRYPLPVKSGDGTWAPGEWTQPAQGDLKPRANGYHVCRQMDLINWINDELYECEIGGDQAACNELGESMICVRRVRLIRRVEGWNERTARLFAAWCARQAMALIPDPDPRSVAVVDTAERFANGRATADELAAARAAAWDVAFDEVWAAQDADRGAAWRVSRAAWAVAGAAWAATSAAARDPVVAARDASRNHYWAATWLEDKAAARLDWAARDAIVEAQNAHLLKMVEEVSHD